MYCFSAVYTLDRPDRLWNNRFMNENDTQDSSHNIEVSLDDAKKRLAEKSAIFIDIRDPQSYEASHIEGADNIGDHNINDFVSKTDKSQPVIIYCYHGNSSLGAVGYLKEQGFSEVWSMVGGFEAWRDKFL
jgi:thiosulfate sulfurtransferase